jgi:hypothetical protein
VIVEGEWGGVQEITLTYVVVHIWDDRRMGLPLTYFIEKPFQNWTRTSSGLLGTVLVWVDYSFPVDDGRTALKQIIESNPLWDKRFQKHHPQCLPQLRTQLGSTNIDSPLDP